jgi:hypothetical protein
VGDPNQISPIGMGNPFKDFIAINEAKRRHVELVTNNRTHAADDDLAHNMLQMISPQNTQCPANHNLGSFPSTMDGLMQYAAELMPPIPGSSTAANSQKLVARLRFGRSVQLNDTRSVEDAAERIFEIYEELRNEYKDIHIVMGSKKAAAAFNKLLGERIRKDIALASNDAFDTEDTDAYLDGAPWIKIGTKVRYMCNYRAAIVPMNETMNNRIRAKKRDAPKEWSAIQAALHWGGQLDEQEGDSRTSDVRVLMRQMFHAEEFRDYIISAPVSNGELDWVQNIETVSMGVGFSPVQIVTLLQSQKRVVMGNWHVSEKHIERGFATTIDSQMGSECNYCIYVINGEKELHWLDRNRMLVACTRARRRLFIVGYNWHVPSGTKLYNALIRREIGAGRRCMLSKSIKEVGEIVLGARVMLQLIYMNQTRIRRSDLVYYL